MQNFATRLAKGSGIAGYQTPMGFLVLLSPTKKREGVILSASGEVVSIVSGEQTSELRAQYPLVVKKTLTHEP